MTNCPTFRTSCDADNRSPHRSNRRVFHRDEDMAANWSRDVTDRTAQKTRMFSHRELTIWTGSYLSQVGNHHHRGIWGGSDRYMSAKTDHNWTNQPILYHGYYGNKLSREMIQLAVSIPTHAHPFHNSLAELIHHLITKNWVRSGRVNAVHKTPFYLNFFLYSLVHELPWLAQ